MNYKNIWSGDADYQRADELPAKLIGSLNTISNETNFTCSAAAHLTTQYIGAAFAAR